MTEHTPLPYEVRGHYGREVWAGDKMLFHMAYSSKVPRLEAVETAAYIVKAANAFPLIEGRVTMSKKKYELATPGHPDYGTVGKIQQLTEYSEPQSATVLKLIKIQDGLMKVTGQLAVEQDTTANLRKALGDLVITQEESLAIIDTLSGVHVPNSEPQALIEARKLLEKTK